jgi:hypothetical protein
MKRYCLILVVLATVLSACYNSVSNSITPQITRYVIKITATTDPNTPTPNLIPSSTPTHTPRPSATPTPTIDVVAFMRDTLLEIMQSPAWQNLQLPINRQTQWVAFASGSSTLDDFEGQQLRDFTAQWRQLHQALEAGYLPANSEPVYKVKEIPVDQGEKSILYVADESTLAEKNEENLYLIATPFSEKSKGLLLAPDIDGFTRQISSDGAFVEYLDQNDEPLLKANARPLNKDNDDEYLLKKYLDREYTGDNYGIYSIYPRYQCEIPEIASRFYGIGNLTYKQILLLKSTFEIFNNEKFQELKHYVFPDGDEVAFIISRYPHDYAAAQAVQRGGNPRKGIILLYTKNLFSNRYETAGSIAHEAAHIWQGDRYDCTRPDMVLQEEIGDGTIPADFYNWTVEQLYQGIIHNDIGSYHVSLWMAMQLDAKNLVDFQRDIILHGRNDPGAVINCP